MTRSLRLFRDGSVADELVNERDNRGHVVGIFTLLGPTFLALLVVTSMDDGRVKVTCL